MDGSDASQEVEEGRGMPGHAKVRPRDEVVLAHVPRLFRVHLTQTQHNYNYNIFTVKIIIATTSYSNNGSYSTRTQLTSLIWKVRTTKSA